MSINTKKLTKGFTIIEVLIVLAIAGLILAIIFLAVPALQRNSRNTSIRSDAAAILAGVNDYVANNQGQLPNAAGITCSNGTVTIDNTTSATDTTSEAKVRGGTQCNGNGVMPSGAAGLGTISIAIGSKCNGNTGFTTSSRAIAAGFLIENGSGATAIATQCIES